MHEDRPEKDTPEEVRLMLEEYGGLSPDGQPLWRAVLAQNVRVMCFGTMNRYTAGFDPGNLPDEARDLGDGSLSADATAMMVRPERVEEGEFWIPRYRIKGWILERWYPARMWGMREQWEQQKARDGRTRLLAAWPSRGGYRMVPCGPWRTLVEAGDLRAAIRCYNFQQRNNPVRWDTWEQAELLAEEKERQDAVDAYAEEIRSRGIGVGHLLRTVSGAAQQWRTHVAEHTAQGVNLGASEKWG